jgi:hypothetical protein
MKRNNKSKNKRKVKAGGKLRLTSKPVRKPELMIPLPAAWE